MDTTVIGVLHSKGNLEKLIEYMDSNHGTPATLMLELPPDWKEHRHRLTQKNTYFYKLADRYENKGSNILAADKYRYLIEPQHPQWFWDLEEKVGSGSWTPQSQGEAISCFLGVTGEMIKHYLVLYKNLLSPSKMRLRNQGFLDAYDKRQPELAVIGDIHARSLKKRRPEINYVPFHTNNMIERLVHPLEKIADPALDLLGYTRW